MPSPAKSRTIFFAVFEPSGDVLAARLIQELKRRDPSLRFVGFGGPKMAQQGVDLLEETTEHAVIALGALGQVREQLRRLGVLSDYLKQNDVAALVPVDSPAANWSVCKKVRKLRPSAKIVHLVCPQVWGWATWRVRRLRKLTDQVLCLLPFEPGWLDERGVPGVFVGHPVFEDAPQVLDKPVADDLPWSGDSGVLRLALMPGSRRSEVEKNWPTMLEVFKAVKAAHPEVVGLCAALKAGGEARFAPLGGVDALPEGMEVVGGRTPEVLRWADVVLAKSGTSTLQVASLCKPMVAFYNVSPVAWQLLGRWLIKSRTFALPNIISEWQDGRRVVPEFIPHFGDPEPITGALDALVGDVAVRGQQEAGLRRVAEPFASVVFKDAAAEALLAGMEAG